MHVPRLRGVRKVCVMDGEALTNNSHRYQIPGIVCYPPSLILPPAGDTGRLCTAIQKMWVHRRLRTGGGCSHQLGEMESESKTSVH